MNYEFLLSSLKLPVLSRDYAFDLDGNGRVDNQLGQVISAMLQQGLDMQATVDKAVSDGKVLILFTVIAQQPLTVDQPADLRVVRAPGTGAGDKLAVPVTLPGRLQAGRFAPDAPPPNSDLVTWVLELPLGPGLPARLTVQWPRFAFGINPSGTRLVDGGLNGSLSGRTVLDDFVPSLADIFTLYIATNPDSETSRTIKSLFDTGGCNNPDGTAAVRGDGRISPCELSENSLIKSLLAPDVRLRNAAGKYEPLPDAAQKDSLSIGFGFTAMLLT
jgi:hypothetical protein